MQEEKQHKSWASGPGVHPGSSRVQVWGEGMPCVISTAKPAHMAGPLPLTHQGFSSAHLKQVPPYCLKCFQVLMSKSIRVLGS